MSTLSMDPATLRQQLKLHTQYKQRAKPQGFHLCQLCKEPFMLASRLERHETHCFLKQCKKRAKETESEVVAATTVEPEQVRELHDQLAVTTELVENPKKRAKLCPTQFFSARYPEAYDLLMWKMCIIGHITVEHVATILDQSSYVQGVLRMLIELMFDETVFPNPAKCPIRTIANPDKLLYMFSPDVSGGAPHWQPWTADNFSNFIYYVDNKLWHKYDEFDAKFQAQHRAAENTMLSNRINEIRDVQARKMAHANLKHADLCEALYTELYKAMIQE